MSAQGEVSEAERRWNEHYLAGNVDAFAALLDDDFLYLSERGEFNKDAYVANLASGAIDMRDLSTIESRSRVYGDATIVTGRVRMSASFQANDISGLDRYTRVWLQTPKASVR